MGLHAAVLLLVVALSLVIGLVTCLCIGVHRAGQTPFMPGSRSAWIAHTCSSTLSLALYEAMRNSWIHSDADCKE